MIVVPEDRIAGLISRADCFDAVEKVFASMARGTAANFAVVREAIGHADALYGFKSGFDRQSLALGLKSGGFWPHNGERGLTNHQSAIFLFDADTGRCRAMVGGNLLTALRTAAASAVSIRHLARPDARILGIVGAGHQAPFQLRAALDQRPFERVVAWNRTPEPLARLRAVSEEAGLPFEAVSLEELGRRADVVVSIVSSFTPVLREAHVRPGTHLACMGTDTKGKQEVETELVARARLFTDEVAQSVTIGECQHAAAAGLIDPKNVVPLGHVIDGKSPGRTHESDVTLFDGTGVGLQDLAVASAVVDGALKAGTALEVAF